MGKVHLQTFAYYSTIQVVRHRGPSVYFVFFNRTESYLTSTQVGKRGASRPTKLQVVVAKEVFLGEPKHGHICTGIEEEEANASVKTGGRQTEETKTETEKRERARERDR